MASEKFMKLCAQGKGLTIVIFSVVRLKRAAVKSFRAASPHIMRSNSQMRNGVERQEHFPNFNFTQLADYNTGKIMGSGSYACVRSAVHTVTGMVVAIKTYD